METTKLLFRKQDEQTSTGVCMPLICFLRDNAGCNVPESVDSYSVASKVAAAVVPLIQKWRIATAEDE